MVVLIFEYELSLPLWELSHPIPLENFFQRFLSVYFIPHLRLRKHTNMEDRRPGFS